MKTKKKPTGMKHKIREEKKREERIALAVLAAILIAIIFISGFFINSMENQPTSSQPSTSQTVNSTSQLKAAIVDHLSLTYPNQTFIETTTNTLKQAGYTVDYYPGENVTVEFYRNLPTHSYSLIILRVHSTLQSLFTSEPYDKTKYTWEQLTKQFIIAKYNKEDEEGFFGITAQFVSSSMKERFQSTIIIMMGCNGLTYADMAQAFIEKGAKVYISWSDAVSASHTDTATTNLLQHLLIKKLTLKESLKQTFNDVGADPTYNSLLIYYPLEAGDYTIQNIESNLVTSSLRNPKQNSLSKERNRQPLNSVTVWKTP